jgi:hypothetical protein
MQVFGGFAQQSKVSKTITPILPTLPVVYQDNVKGGMHQVEDLFTNDIATELKQVGMVTWDVLTQCYYQWNGSNWEAINLFKTWADGATVKKNELYVRAGHLFQAVADNTIDANGADDNDTEPLTDSNWLSVGDNFGNHIATKNIQLASHGLSADGDKLETDPTAEGLFFDTDGNAVFKQNVTIKGDLSIPSDGRLKTNVRVLNGMLGKLQNLHGVQFEYTNQQEYASGKQYGVIAQELQKEFPTMVKMGEDGFYKVNYLQLTAVLLQAINEQQILINKLLDEQ